MAEAAPVTKVAVKNRIDGRDSKRESLRSTFARGLDRTFGSFVGDHVYEVQTVQITPRCEREIQRSLLESVFTRICIERVSEQSTSSLSRVFRSAYLELQRIAESGLADKSSLTETAPRLSGLDNLERTIRKGVEQEIAITESRLQFLATVGSTAPFVGLLGTVVGIMTSFGNIAASGSASLAVVAPGISEALFSTAVGLFAALPAVAAYNIYITDIRKFEMELNSFGSDFLNIAKRNFFKGE